MYPAGSFEPDATSALAVSVGSRERFHSQGWFIDSQLLASC